MGFGCRPGDTAAAGREQTGLRVRWGADDIANRMTAIVYYGLESYAYNPQNQRVWRKTVNGSGQATEVFSFYGIDGKVLETYTPTYSGTEMALTQAEEELYFAGRLIGRTNWQYVNTFQPISADPLGTVRWDAAATAVGFADRSTPHSPLRSARRRRTNTRATSYR